MPQPGLTDQEKRYLDDLRRLPTTVRSRLVGWALELIPSIGLFAYGFLTDHRVFMMFGFLSLLYFAVWRMYGQLRGFRLIQSVYTKQLSAANPDVN